MGRFDERAPAASSTSDVMSRLTTVAGLGPHGEFPAPMDELRVSDQKAQEARLARYNVAVIVHSIRSDWSQLQIAGILTTLNEYQANVVDVVDCDFDPRRQVSVLESLVERRPDAIISIPVDNARTAEAHKRVTQAGIRLVLMDNVPLGMLPRKDYACVVSADNFGNGQIAAEILSGYVPGGGAVGIVGFGIDYFVTNEREIAFRKWMQERRPDVKLRHVAFADVAGAGDAAVSLLDASPEVSALFVVWDEPALQVANALRTARRQIPLATVDLGNEVAMEVANGSLIKGLGAQRPYDQGVAEATATIMALLGDEPPPWVALPALSVTRRNVLEAYEAVWHSPPSEALRDLAER
jgi:ribose transport system substrate-binding protein